MKACGVSVGRSFPIDYKTVTGTVTNYSQPKQLNKFSGFTLADLALYAARQLCK